jgi:hypothetical protein
VYSGEEVEEQNKIYKLVGVISGWANEKRRREVKRCA